MLVLHTVKYNNYEQELQWFEDWHCFEIVWYTDTDKRHWFRVYYDTQMLAVLWSIWEAEWYCRWLSDWLCDRPTWHEISKLIMNITLPDNWHYVARWLCLWHLFQIIYDEDEEWYEEYSIAIDSDIVEDVWSFEEALWYCYWYAEWLDPNKPLYLKKGKWVINILDNNK